MEWVEIANLARDEDANREFRSLLFQYKNFPDKWNRIYTYDTHNRSWFYIDGTKKDAYIN